MFCISFPRRSFAFTVLISLTNVFSENKRRPIDVASIFVRSTPCLNNNCATTHSFISLKHVDQFSRWYGASEWLIRPCRNAIDWRTPCRKFRATAVSCMQVQNDTMLIGDRSTIVWRVSPRLLLGLQWKRAMSWSQCHVRRYIDGASTPNCVV